MEILSKRRHVEYHDSLNANVFARVSDSVPLVGVSRVFFLIIYFCVLNTLIALCWDSHQSISADVPPAVELIGSGKD